MSMYKSLKHHNTFLSFCKYSCASNPYLFHVLNIQDIIIVHALLIIYHQCKMHIITYIFYHIKLYDQKSHACIHIYMYIHGTHTYIYILPKPTFHVHHFKSLKLLEHSLNLTCMHF